jgi:hypothetical protein
MKMNFEQPGIDTFRSEVTSIGAHGFWLLVGNKEYFVAFADYPAFREASVAEIFHVHQLGPNQLHWPTLDIDIELGALEEPDSYPLTWRN